MSLKRVAYLCICLLLLASCSVTKFVPENEYLLNDVNIISNTNPEMAKKAHSYVRQQPNAKWFSLVKLPLYTYSLSGKDTTVWVNRFLQKIGEPPVIYSPKLAEQTRANIEQMLRNEGYLHATVDLEREYGKKHRLNAIYYLHERERYTISSFALETQDSALAKVLAEEADASLLRPGMPFSVDKLEAERKRITTMLKDRGYYRFQKDYITFVADTAQHSTKVNVKMYIALFRQGANKTPVNHKIYKFNNILFNNQDKIINLNGAGSSLYEQLQEIEYENGDKYIVWIKEKTENIQIIGIIKIEKIIIIAIAIIIITIILFIRKKHFNLIIPCIKTMN